MSPNHPSPNLLPKQSFEARPLPEKLIIFLGSYGRHIIILCQFFVVLAFAWRFILDEQLSRLNQKLNNQIATVKSLAATEESWRKVQAELTLVKEIKASNVSLPDTLDTFIAQLPPEILPLSLTAKKGGLTLTAKTGSLSSLAKFIVNLKQQAKFKEIYLNSAKLDTLNQTFTLQISVTT